VTADDPKQLSRFKICLHSKPQSVYKSDKKRS